VQPKARRLSASSFCIVEKCTHDDSSKPETYREVQLTLWDSAAACNNGLLSPFALRIGANLHISN